VIAPDDWSFTGTDTASSPATAAFIPMPIFRQAADESFIDLDNAAEFVNIFHKCDADAVAHIPSRIQGTEAHITPNLPSAHPLLASEHQMNDAIPIAERFISVLENSARDDRKSIAVRGTFFALPMPFAGFKIIDLGIATTWAMDAIGPAPRVQVSLARVFVGEHRLELWDGQLVDLSGLFCAGHSLSSECKRTDYHETERLSSHGTSPSLARAWQVFKYTGRDGPTISFGLAYALVIARLDRRDLIWNNVTRILQITPKAGSLFHANSQSWLLPSVPGTRSA